MELKRKTSRFYISVSFIFIFIFFCDCCRDKAIQALQAILHKYDVEVGEERTRELEELRNALEMQRKEFAVWKETVYEPQIVL